MQDGGTVFHRGRCCGNDLRRERHAVQTDPSPVEFAVHVPFSVQPCQLIPAVVDQFAFIAVIDSCLQFIRLEHALQLLAERDFESGVRHRRFLARKLLERLLVNRLSLLVRQRCQILLHILVQAPGDLIVIQRPGRGIVTDFIDVLQTRHEAAEPINRSRHVYGDALCFTECAVFPMIHDGILDQAFDSA